MRLVELAQSLRAPARPWLGVALVLLASWGTRAALAALTDAGGFVSVSGFPSLPVAIVGLVALPLRVGAVVGVPAFVVYRVVLWALPGRARG